MTVLHVALDALGTKHAAIERKLFPRFKADDLVLADLQLNPALLPTKAAVGLEQFFGGMDGFILPPAWRHMLWVRPELLFENFFRSGGLSHGLPLSISSAPAKAICVCTWDTSPANFPPGPPWRS